MIPREPYEPPGRGRELTADPARLIPLRQLLATDRPVMIAMPFLALLLPFSALYYGGSSAILAAIFFVGWGVVGIFPLFMATVPSESVDPRYTATALGTETLTVGGEQVETWHTRVVSKQTGETVGGDTSEFWLDERGCRKKIEALRSDGIFTPPTVDGTLMNPVKVTKVLQTVGDHLLVDDGCSDRWAATLDRIATLTAHVTMVGDVAAMAPSTTIEVAHDSTGGVVLECVEESGRLRVHVVSDGYRRDWPVQFPKGIREPRVRYLVTGVREASRGGFYRAYGDIRRLV